MNRSSNNKNSNHNLNLNDNNDSDPNDDDDSGWGGDGASDNGNGNDGASDNGNSNDGWDDCFEDYDVGLGLGTDNDTNRANNTATSFNALSALFATQRAKGCNCNALMEQYPFNAALYDNRSSAALKSKSGKKRSKTNNKNKDILSCK